MNRKTIVGARRRTGSRVPLPMVVVVALVASLVAFSGPSPSASAQTAPPAGVYMPLSPARIYDSRNAGAGGLFAPNTSRDIQVTGQGGVPTTDVLAVVLDVTIANSVGDGWGLVWQAGTTRPFPASTINFRPGGQAVTNTATSKVSAAGKVSYFSSGTTNLIVDVVGYYRSSPGAGGYVPLTQTRILDTRDSGIMIVSGRTFDLPLRGAAGVPASTAVSAVAMNVSTFDQQGGGYVTVWPRGATRPGTSSLNYGPSRMDTQMVIASVGADGWVSVYNGGASINMVFDVVGYYIAGAGARFVPLTPTRVIDTRYDIPGWGIGPLTQPLAPNTNTAVQLTGVGGVPTTSVNTVMINVIAGGTSSWGVMDFWASGDTQPTTLTHTYYPNQASTNLVLAKVGPDGKAMVTNLYGSSMLVIDVIGYFTTDVSYGTNSTLTTPIAAGLDHSLAVRSPDGTVYAWGRNQTGQIGNGTTSAQGVQSGIVPGLSGVVSVAAGDGHSLALRNDGTVWAWGSNQAGELGDDDAGIDKASPVQVANLAGISAVAAGCDHSLALGADGNVWAWGSNSSGQLGLTSQYPFSQVWTHVQGVGSIRAIAAGCTFSMALGTDGSVWTWGDNAFGQLGDGTLTGGPTPRKVGSLPGITSVSAGRFHALAVDVSGNVRAWGRNDSGQLGDGTATNRAAPVVVNNLTGVAAITGGAAHSAAVLLGGEVWAWGANNRHQLGTNTTVASLVPVQVHRDTAGGLLSGMLPVIAAGGDHTFGVSSQLIILEWGDHGNGSDCTVATTQPAPGVGRGPGPTITPPPVPPNTECDGQTRPSNDPYLPLDALGRPTGAATTLNSTVLRSGTKAPLSMRPPGYVDGVGLVRGHLLAKVLGGSGTETRNIVAEYTSANQTQRNIEVAIRDRLQLQCEVITYSVSVSYAGNNCNTAVVPAVGVDCKPRDITLAATGTKGYVLPSTVISNVP